MMSRREALAVLGSAYAATLFTDPKLAPGEPMSAQRRALVDAFKHKSEGIETKFEARTHKSDWEMPYRLFKPQKSGRLPLVLFLHGSGGLGTDNVKQMGLGNIFGTRLWALPEIQAKHPCYVVAPQTDRGWLRYAEPAPGDSVARVVEGLGEGARLAFEIIDSLKRELSIDERRIYMTGQSMGGGGAWHMMTQRPKFFAAAAVCCGSRSLDDVSKAKSTAIWNFHGDADATVPVEVSRERLALLRKAGAHPVQTEYHGVGHNSWEWAYTEPVLPDWLFSHGR